MRVRCFPGGEIAWEFKWLMQVREDGAVQAKAVEDVHLGVVGCANDPVCVAISSVAQVNSTTSHRFTSF